jgi:hypothetical protein
MVMAMVMVENEYDDYDNADDDDDDNNDDADYSHCKYHFLPFLCSTMCSFL